MTTERAQRNPSLKIGLLTAATVMSVLLLAWSAHTNFKSTVELNRRAELTAPNAVIHHPLDSVNQALAALKIKNLNGDTTQLTVKVWSGDSQAAIRQIHNIAVQKGWYPHSHHETGLEIVLPKGDESELLQLEEDPYQWLKNQHNVGAGPKEITLQDSAKHVNLKVRMKNQGKAVWHAVGGILSASLGATIILVAGMILLDKWLISRRG